MSSDGSGNIQVGLFLTNQQAVGDDQVKALSGQLRLASAAREAGWDSIFVGQHYLTEGMAHIQPVPFLARLAAEAEGMRLGVGISLIALHNPVYLAETYASLDIITGGRLTWGVGLGYRDVEYNAFGIGHGERLKRFETNLDIVLRLWNGEEVTADLSWCRLDRQKLNLLPVQRPRPPLWMAANSDKAVERAGRLADSWYINPHATTQTIRRQLDLYRAERIRVGKKKEDELPLMREIFCGSTREAALEAARPYLSRKYQAYASWGQDKVLPGNDSFSVPFESLEQQRFIIGSPEECLAELLPWRDEVGVNHFLFRTDWVGMPADVTLRSLKLLANEVVPVLKAGN